MAFNYKDRQSNRPNRYKVTPDSGTEYFVTLERADEPTELGTPINAENLNKALDKTGDTMSGSLNMRGGSYPTIYFTPPGGVGDSAVEGGDRVISLHARDAQGISAPRRQLAVYAPNARTVSESVRLIDTDVDGNKTYYYLYGEHNKPTAPEIGAIPAAESGVYEGCYWRTVGGETEWVNPAMISGKEYRTNERNNGKAVYVKLVDLGTLPASGNKNVTYSSTSVIPVSIEGYVRTSSGYLNDMPFFDVSGTQKCKVYATETKVVVVTYSDCSSNTGYAIVKYTKLGGSVEGDVDG